MKQVAGLIDRALEATVAGSFTRVGFDVRSRLAGWRSIDSYDATGSVVAITGATSGLGLAAAEALFRRGAVVWVIGRDDAKTERVAAEIRRRHPQSSGSILTAIANMAELDDVRRLAETLTTGGDVPTTMIHNAGALAATWQANAAGLEVTVASQVLGPFLLTQQLVPVVRLGAHHTGTAGRVITMSSGGMYAAPLKVNGLQMSPSEYKGATQYALAKRAQVTLNEMWAAAIPATDVVFHAVHPGWADTPGVAEALPAFRRLTRPLLRSSEQGADTMLWLAVDDGQPLTTSGTFWHDRAVRPIHRLPRTRHSDTPEQRQRLWDWCQTMVTG